MLRFGIVSQINPSLVQARVSFEDDELTSYWLPILQTKTLNDKFYFMPDIGEQVVCLMDENSEDGVILGAIYSSEDESHSTSEKEFSMVLDNGNFIKADKEEESLTINFSTIHLIGNIQHDGMFQNSDGITSRAEITDKTSSMQYMRDVYNSHNHTGNQGSPTSTPNKTM